MSLKRLPNRAMFTGVDSVFNERCSAYVVLPFGEDGLILLQKRLSFSSLLFGQLIRQTIHHALNYVYFLFRLGCSLIALFRLNYFGVLQLSQPCAFLQHVFSVIRINYSDVQLRKLSMKDTSAIIHATQIRYLEAFGNCLERLSRSSASADSYRHNRLSFRR